MFIDWLQDEGGDTYEYGHCAYDDDDGNEFGCGMEYAYYADDERLECWHDAVGQVTVSQPFTSADRDALEAEHSGHATMVAP